MRATPLVQVACAGAVTLCLAAMPAGANLLTNGGFEQLAVAQPREPLQTGARASWTVHLQGVAACFTHEVEQQKGPARDVIPVQVGDEQSPQAGVIDLEPLHRADRRRGDVHPKGRVEARVPDDRLGSPTVGMEGVSGTQAPTTQQSPAPAGEKGKF